MSLPNYSPKGKVLFGSVPWDNGYSNVRLYTDLTSQYNDIVSRMVLSSDNYVYIGRNRRLKVSIEADRMYHVNYCMYKNESLTDGWIYCFVTDVEYINDNTTEITLETDVFQTYLYNVDWTIPPCFIERETVPSESSKYLLTSEPEMPLVYTSTGERWQKFRFGGIVIQTCEHPLYSKDIIEDILNPTGAYGVGVGSSLYRGTMLGANYLVCPWGEIVGEFIGIQGTTQEGIANSENVGKWLDTMTQAGATGAITNIFSFPSGFGIEGGTGGWVGEDKQMEKNEYQLNVNAPDWATTVDGYLPKNKKLLYYPYTFAKVSDNNGATLELRYELWEKPYYIGVKYSINGACQATAVARNYMGIEDDFTHSFATSCGSQGSWANDQFGNWVAQNSTSIAVSMATDVLSLVPQTKGLSAATKSLNAAGNKLAKKATGKRVRAYSEALENYNQVAGETAYGLAQTFGSTYGEITNMMHQPIVMKGSNSYDVTWQNGTQGIRINRMCLKAELAEKLDEFFTRWGYAVEAIEPVNITSRPVFNYVKTGGAAPKSTNVGTTSSAPFTRGRGTPAAALSIIREAFDGGITFWHTTSNFGNFGLDNSL